MKLEIANILREAADKIAALDRRFTADEIVRDSIAEPPAPALPEPPEGFHKAMMGPLKVKARGVQMMDVISYSTKLGWHDEEEGFWGNSRLSYALRIGSEIARLNGLEPEAIPADKEPEPAKRREFWIDAMELDEVVSLIGSGNAPLKEGDRLRVREVLPVDPSHEQVEELVSVALSAALVIGCENPPSIAVENVKERLKSALQPFTGKESK